MNFVLNLYVITCQCISVWLRSPSGTARTILCRQMYTEKTHTHTHIHMASSTEAQRLEQNGIWNVLAKNVSTVKVFFAETFQISFCSPTSSAEMVNWRRRRCTCHENQHTQTILALYSNRLYMRFSRCKGKCSVFSPKASSSLLTHFPLLSGPHYPIICWALMIDAFVWNFHSKCFK